YSSVFYFNIVLGFLLYGILFYLSSHIAKFYSETALENVAKVLFLLIPISSFSIVQNAILTKEYLFKQLSYISLISSVISGILGITFAYLLRNYWALVIQAISQSLLKSILYFTFNIW